MDNLKLKALEYFAAKPHDDVKAKKYLNTAYKSIHNILIEPSSYDSLSSAFDELEKFISHVADDAINDLELCWNQLHKDADLELSETYFSEYHTKEKLFAKIIDLLSKLRYIEQEKVIPILFHFWEEEGSTKRDVEKVFKELAEFNLNAVEQIGFSAQLKLLDVIARLSDDDKFKFFPIVIVIFEQFLSTEIQGYDWEYRTVSIKSMAIPASEQVNKLRSETVSSLICMYQSTTIIDVKKKLLSAMNMAFSIWSRTHVTGDAKLIVETNTVDVLNFWVSIVATEPLELIQKVEHDAYWSYYHASSQLVKEAALSVEAEINNNKEYQVYRDLVGFEGVFGSWSEEQNIEIDDYDKQQKIRAERVKLHIENVNEENLHKWLIRVEHYLETDSRDLATFPELFKFVEVISNRFPKEVLSKFEKTVALDKSAVPIFTGIWNSSFKNEFINKVAEWIDGSKYLWELSIAFIRFSEPNNTLIDQFIDKTIAIEDIQSLSSLLRIFDDPHGYLSEEEINQFFEKIFIFLNKKQSTVWLHYAWFARRNQSFIKLLSEANAKLLVDNLVNAKDVDHRVEAILENVSKNNKADVFYFFEQRIKLSKQRGKPLQGRYEDIPFKLYSIDNVLAENPEELVRLIKRNYEYEYGLHQYGVARLFKECFLPFEPQLIEIILKHLNPSSDQEFNLILAIISSYEGHISILPLLKRILKEIKYDEDKVRRMNDSLMGTGVVHGEYGIANAYKSKLADISSWLEDDHVNVVKFANQYCHLLKRIIEEEVKRVDEDVAIEKHRYNLDEPD